MTIDERLEFLRQSTESLHASCQELHASLIEEREARRGLGAEIRQARRAALAAIQQYLRVLEEGANGGEKP